MESAPKCPATELALTQRIVRARSLAKVGVSGATLQQILKKGGLVRIGRRLYASPDRTVTELDHLAQIAIKHPGCGVLFAHCTSGSRLDNAIAKQGLGGDFIKG